MTAYVDISGTPSRFPSGWNPAISATSQERRAWMQETNSRRTLRLSSLMDGMPGLTPAWGAVMAEAASVCLESQGHRLSVDLRVDGDFRELLVVQRLEVSEQMRNAHRNGDKTTEHGAYGVALLTVSRLTGETVLNQSWTMTGFDYRLGPRQEEESFQDSTRLEISGIRKGTERTIRARVQEKITQMKSHPWIGPSLVAVVEFSRPSVRIVKS